MPLKINRYKQKDKQSNKHNKSNIQIIQSCSVDHSQWKVVVDFLLTFCGTRYTEHCQVVVDFILTWCGAQCTEHCQVVVDFLLTCFGARYTEHCQLVVDFLLTCCREQCQVTRCWCMVYGALSDCCSRSDSRPISRPSNSENTTGNTWSTSVYLSL